MLRSERGKKKQLKTTEVVLKKLFMKMGSRKYSIMRVRNTQIKERREQYEMHYKKRHSTIKRKKNNQKI